MKKVAVMLLVGGLMLTGCGAATESAPKEVAVEENAPTVEVNTDDSVSVSAAAIENEPVEEETENQEYLTPDEQFIKDHTVEYENTVAEDNSCVYFPEATNLLSGKEAFDAVMYWKHDKDNLDFTMKHIRYDFLVTEGKDGLSASISNMYSIGAKLKSDYIKELNVPEEDLIIKESVHEVSGVPVSYCFIGVKPDNEPVIDTSKYKTIEEVDAAIQEIGHIDRFGTVIMAYPTLDDANNGVTVVELENVESSECLF